MRIKIPTYKPAAWNPFDFPCCHPDEMLPDPPAVRPVPGPDDPRTEEEALAEMEAAGIRFRRCQSCGRLWVKMGDGAFETAVPSGEKEIDVPRKALGGNPVVGGHL